MSSTDYSQYDTAFNQTAASSDFASKVLGPHTVGWAGEIAIWGVLCGLFTEYVRSDLWRRDSLRRKALVLFVFAVSIVQTGMNFYLLVYWATQQDRSALTILKPSVVNALQPISVLLTGVPVQVFLVSRATRLLESSWARRCSYAFFGILIVLQAFFMLFNTTLNYLFNGGKLTGEILSIVTYNIDSGIWLTAGALVDVGVTTILVVVLKKKIGESFQSTDSLLRKLIALSIESASYTAVLAVLAVIVTYSLPSGRLDLTSIPFVFWYLLPVCYPLSLLTALRSRLIFHQSGNSSGSGNVNGVPMRGLGASTSGCTCGARSQHPTFKRNTTHRSRIDRETGFGAHSGIQVLSTVVVDVDSEQRDDRLSPQRIKFAVPSLAITDLEKGGHDDWDSEDGGKTLQ